MYRTSRARSEEVGPKMFGHINRRDNLFPKGSTSTKCLGNSVDLFIEEPGTILHLKKSHVSSSSQIFNESFTQYNVFGFMKFYTVKDSRFLLLYGSHTGTFPLEEWGRVGSRRGPPSGVTGTGTRDS